ncbi:PREDICTED: semaphorin-5A-like, partial [Tinamus guttatus]|uniref:semaphorin-5A-like n=1 Tax=Tinamus guttatus TaxID=94827 RepID=UPI00052ED0C6
MTTMKGSCLLALLLTGLGVLGILESTTKEDTHCHRAEHPVISYKEIAPWLYMFRSEDAVDFSQLTFDPGQKELIAGARNYLFRLQLEDLSLIQ